MMRPLPPVDDMTALAWLEAERAAAERMIDRHPHAPEMRRRHALRLAAILRVSELAALALHGRPRIASFR